MMTDVDFNPPASAPMAKLLSPILMVGQWVFSVFFVIFLIMALIMAVPSGFRESLIAEAPTQIDPTSLMSRCLAGAVVAVGWFFVLKLLRGVVTAVVHGDPFLHENILSGFLVCTFYALHLFYLIVFFAGNF